MSKTDIIKDEINKIGIELSNAITSAQSNLKDSLSGSGMNEFDIQINKASKLSKRLLKLVRQLPAKTTLNSRK